MSDPLRRLPTNLVNERGMSPGVHIARPGSKPSDENYRKCSVGEFLSRPENQSGEWLIDGGWGGPPGAIKVSWDDDSQDWENLGFPPWTNSVYFVM